MRNVAELELAAGELVFLDRIEDQVATLILDRDGEREESVPADQLPEEAREGDRLRMSAEGCLIVDPEATTSGRDAVADLMAELLGQSAADPGTPASDGPEANTTE